MSNLKFKQVYKDKLFFNTYKYVFKFYLEELSALRYLEHEKIDEIIQARRKWRTNAVRLGTKSHKAISEETVAKLHSLLDEVLSIETQHKLVISWNTGYLYTNDTKVIDKFDNLDYLFVKGYSEAVINRPLNTIKLKKPVHKHRSYFRFSKLESNEREAIKKFLEAQGAEVRMSPALQTFVNKSPYKIAMDHYFIDYNDAGILVMLSLIKPNLIRKTLDIIKA